MKRILERVKTHLLKYEIRPIPARADGSQTMPYKPGEPLNGLGLSELAGRVDDLGLRHNVCRISDRFVRMRFGVYSGSTLVLKLELPVYYLDNIYDHAVTFRYAGLVDNDFAATRLLPPIDAALAQYQRGDEPADLAPHFGRIPVCSSVRESAWLLMILRQLYGAGLPRADPEPTPAALRRLPGEDPPEPRGAAAQLLRERFLPA